MITETTKKLREPIAIGLLAVAVLYFVSGISLLFKSRDDIGFDFPGRAALDGHVFTDPLVVISLAVAVLLVISWGEASRNARAIVLAALVIGGLCLLFAVVSWVASLTSEQVSAYGGVNGAGRIVGIFLGLAQIVFLALALTYAASVFQSFPKPVRANQQWGQHAQWAQQPQWGQQPQWQQQQQWGQQPQQQQHGWGPPQQQSWGQPSQQTTWAEPQQQWGQPSQAWGESPGSTPPPGSGWGSSSSGPPAQSTWGEAAEQSGWTHAPEPRAPSAWPTPEASDSPPAHAARSESDEIDVTPAAADDDGALDIAETDSSATEGDGPWATPPAVGTDRDAPNDDSNGDEDVDRTRPAGTSESDSGWWRPSSP